MDKQKIPSYLIARENNKIKNIPGDSVYSTPELHPIPNVPVPASFNPFIKEYGDVYTTPSLCVIVIGDIKSNRGIFLGKKDWVGVFSTSGNLIGTYKWDTSQCNNDICSINVFGKTGDPRSIYNAGDGEAVYFQVWLGGKKEFYNAEPSPPATITFDGTAFIYVPRLIFDTSPIPPPPDLDPSVE